MLLSFSLVLACGILGTFAIPSDNINLLKIMDFRNFGLDFYKNIWSLDSVAKYKNLDAQCLLQLQAIENGLLLNDLWSIKFIDAWGKVPSGILYGHLVEMGNYDECLGIMHNIAPSEINMQGKYCLANISIGQILNSTKIPKLQIGICIPAACEAEQLNAPLEEVLAKILNPSSTTVGTNTDAVLLKESSCSTAEKINFEVINWIAICILSIIAAFMVASTIYDYLTTYHGNPVHPLVGSFSVRANMRKLFHISTHNSAPHTIPCLHGIRCMSIVWIVFLHTNSQMTKAPNINNIQLDTFRRSLYSNFWQCGIIAVDTFFFLSGMLIITVSFRQMEKSAGHINVPRMYIHRYLRLTPVLALEVLLEMSVNRYIGIGPIKSKVNQMCIDYWWATLLYVQNYVTDGQICAGHSWYLAADMQLYLISPLILLAIWKWKKKAIAGILVIGLLLAAALFFIIIVDNISVATLFGYKGHFPDNIEELFKNYIATHTRVSPWIIGIVFGYFLHRRAGKRSTLSKFTVVIGWLSALCLLCSVLFALYPMKQINATPLTTMEGAAFLPLSRIAWPLALAWIVFACANGLGGSINQFLSYSLWQPLSKLSYCVYIWHMEVIRINAKRIKTNSYLSDYDGILRFWTDFGISLLVSLLMYLAVESPMLSIEKFLLIHWSQKSNHNHNKNDRTTVSQQIICKSMVTLPE